MDTANSFPAATVGADRSGAAIFWRHTSFPVTGMDVSGTGQEQVVRFTTNVGDAVAASEATPIRFVEADEPGVYIPYVRVRDRLEARINRAVFYDLVELGQVKRIDGIDWFGLWSGDRFWQIAPAADIGAE